MQGSTLLAIFGAHYLFLGYCKTTLFNFYDNYCNFFVCLIFFIKFLQYQEYILKVSELSEYFVLNYIGGL